jgi:hypothetical protein
MLRRTKASKLENGDPIVRLPARQQRLLQPEFASQLVSVLIFAVALAEA